MEKKYDSTYSIALDILKNVEQGGGGGGLTPEQVRNIIETYNYITMADVEEKGYTTMPEVEDKGYITSNDLPKEWFGTQEEFDAIAEKDENTTYFIYE